MQSFYVPLKTWGKIGLGIFVGYFCVLLLSDNFSRYGEAISYSGWLRTIEGKPYLSQANELPLGLNCYTPIFLLPLTLLTKIVNVPSIIWYSVIAKFYSFILLAALLVVLYRIASLALSEQLSFGIFFLPCSFVLFHTPDILFSLRPDLLSYLCDALGVYWILRHLNGKKTNALVFAAISTGMAVAVKLNSVGVTLAIFTYLAINRKVWSAFLYGSISLLVFLTPIGIYFLLWKQATFDNLFASVQSAILPLSALLTVYRQVLELLFFPLLPLFFLVVLGVFAMQSKEKTGDAKHHSLLWILLLLSQFVIASLGQIKWGAFFNYYFGMLFLSIVPAVHGVVWISRVKSPVLEKGILALSFVAIGLLLLRDVYTPVQIFKQNILVGNKGFSPVAEYLKSKIPQGAVYTTSHNASVHLHDRVMLGAVSEELLSTTPVLRRFQKELFEKLSRVDFKAAVIESPGCAQWRPPEYFGASLGAVTRLTFQANGICVFQPN